MLDSLMSKIIDYFSKVKLEFFKISWLKPKELSQLLITVLVITFVSSCFFGVCDMFMSAIILKIFAL